MDKRMKDFKDGVADGLLHGRRKEGATSFDYEQGYDFGLYLYNEQLQGEDESEEENEQIPYRT